MIKALIEKKIGQAIDLFKMNECEVKAMPNTAFKSLIDGLNAQIAVMNENNLKIYDAENPEYFISGIEYRADADSTIFKTEEDPQAYLRQ